MTSATVTQLGEMIANINNNMGNMDSQNGEFAGIFQTAAEKTEGTDKTETAAVKTYATEKTISTSKKAEELQNTQAEEETDVPKDMESVENELEEVASELKNEIAEKLDMTVEELEAVMETLGLTNISLLTQEGMASLVMEVEKVATPVELLTNAEAYQTLQELNAIATELVGEVQTEFQLTDEQVQEAITQFAESTKMPMETETQEMPLVEAENKLAEADVEMNAEEPTEQKAGGKTETVTEETVIQEGNESVVKESRAKEGNEEQQSGNDSRMATEHTIQPNNTQTVNQANADFSKNIIADNYNAQEIYEQIGEYIKTNIRPGISEVEMQLNPESLGTLHIHLSSKQGNVTAQLTVQNELVKAALEVQLIQLKETFTEQGIKVDAVEVTVESHAFNQNMQQSNEENAQAQTEAKRSSVRSINLNGDWAEEELTEEEQLVAEMMEANGNTVDYMA